MAQIEMIVDLEGNTVTKVNDMVGPGCKALTKDLEAMLGDVTKDIKTAEFYQTAKQAQPVKQKG